MPYTYTSYLKPYALYLNFDYIYKITNRHEENFDGGSGCGSYGGLQQ
jgi:hypothetical protein